MEADEVELWQYYLSEPRGEKRSDYHAAQICHAVYTILTSFGDGKTKLKLEDNLLKFEPYKSDEERAEESVLKNIAVLQGMFGASSKPLVDKLKSVDRDKDNLE